MNKCGHKNPVNLVRLFAIVFSLYGNRILSLNPGVRVITVTSLQIARINAASSNGCPCARTITE